MRVRPPSTASSNRPSKRRRPGSPRCGSRARSSATRWPRSRWRDGPRRRSSSAPRCWSPTPRTPSSPRPGPVRPRRPWAGPVSCWAWARRTTWRSSACTGCRTHTSAGTPRSTPASWSPRSGVRRCSSTAKTSRCTSARPPPRRSPFRCCSAPSRPACSGSRARWPTARSRGWPTGRHWSRTSCPASRAAADAGGPLGAADRGGTAGRSARRRRRSARRRGPPVRVLRRTAQLRAHPPGRRPRTIRRRLCRR